MQVEPRTSYLERPEGRVAYQVVDGGPGGTVVVWLHEMPIHLDLAWTDPSVADAVSEGVRDGLTAIMVQQRGIGLSDAVSRPATIEELAADVVSVMDAEGVEVATLGGDFSTCLPVALVAAQRPERVTGLVLMNAVLAGPRSATPVDGYTPEQIESGIAALEAVKERWGSGSWLELWDPNVAASPLNLRLAGMIERCAASPEMAAAVIDHWMAMRGEDILRQVRVPTRVIRLPDHAVVPRAAVQAAAAAIPGAGYHDLPASAKGDPLGPLWSRAMDHIVQITVGAGAKYGRPERAMVSVVFLDVVGSTERLAELGDQAWAGVLGELEQRVRSELAEWDGRFVKGTGDGALCELPGPTAAVRCAQAICDGAPELGIEVRAGVHTGECERRRDDLAGMAVHIGARVCGAAGPGQVLVSRTVRDLVAGSEIALTSRGEHELKGVPDTWELFSVGAEAPAGVPLPPAQPTAADRAMVKMARRVPGALRSAGRLTDAVQRRRPGRGT